MNIDKRRTDSGFSLFTVIITVSFIAILGLLVIYISVSNFYMKVTDLKNKDGFYTAERGLEEVKVGLQQDVGNAMSKAFTDIMENYNDEDAPQGGDAKRQEDFRDLYINTYLKSLLQKDENNPQLYNIDYLNNEDHLNKGNVLTDESRESLLLVSDGNPYMEDMKTNKDGKEEVTGIILKNLKIIYVDAKGRASIIKTDICLGTPEVRFPTSSTLPDLMSMVVVANGGIICEADENNHTPVTLKGNIYAGLINPDQNKDQIITSQIKQDFGNLKDYDTSIWIKKGAGLNVDSNNMLVTRAEIMVDQGTFTTGSKVQLWTRGITVNSAEQEQGIVTLKGTSYVADDITVVSGTGANISLQGDYYGYGSVDSINTLKTDIEKREEKARTDGDKEKEELYKTIKAGIEEQYKTGKSALPQNEKGEPEDTYSNSADFSSAIVINGKNTLLDISKINKMLLSGKSYISAPKSSSSNNDVLTGESITVKGSQLAYLAPSEIIGNITNPVEITTENQENLSILANIDDSNSKIVKWDEICNIPVESWGGKTLNDLEKMGIKFDKTQPIQRVIYRDPGSQQYAYFYLNFEKNTSSSSKYMQFYYTSNDEAIKTNMDEFLRFYFKNETSGIFVNDDEAYVRYITDGNVLGFQVDSKTGIKQGKLYENTDQTAMTGLVDTSANKRLMWYTLNRKMVGIDKYEHLDVDKTDSDANGSHNEASYSQTVFDNLVNEEKMTDYLNNNYADKMCQYPDENPTVIMYDNKNNDALYIDKELADTLRLVVCTGDVVIDKDVSFNGIIMAKGKITLKAGSKLQATPIEAANAFQSQMDANTELKPQDFFWDGNDYIRGNTNSEDSTELNIADYVYYKNWKKE